MNKNIKGDFQICISVPLKPYIEFDTQERIEAAKNNDEDGKTVYKLMNNVIYRKTKGNLRNRIDIKLVKNEKDYLECTSKPSYMLHKIFDNNLVVICKSRLVLNLDKLAYIATCMLELSKVLMCEFHYDYYKNKYDNKSKLIFTDTDSLMYEIKTGDIYKDFRSNKELLDFNNYSIKAKYYDDSKKLVTGKMEDETGGVAIEELIELKPKTHWFIVDNREHKNLKVWIKMLLQQQVIINIKTFFSQAY